MGDPGRITIVRGDYTISPGEAWTSASATWPVVVVSRETSCPDGCREDHIHGTRQRAWAGGVSETPGPVTELHLACTRCVDLPSLLCLSPSTDASPYEVCVADMLSGILAHLRRSHPDVVAS